MHLGCSGSSIALDDVDVRLAIGVCISDEICNRRVGARRIHPGRSVNKEAFELVGTVQHMHLGLAGAAIAFDYIQIQLAITVVVSELEVPCEAGARCSQSRRRLEQVRLELVVSIPHMDIRPPYTTFSLYPIHVDPAVT